MNYKIVAKYIKDLRFEIPNTKAFFLLEKDISNYKVKIDIKSNQFKEKLIEVEITLALTSSEENKDKINTKIIYSTLIEIDGDLSQKNVRRNYFNKSSNRGLSRNKKFVYFFI